MNNNPHLQVNPTNQNHFVTSHIVPGQSVGHNQLVPLNRLPNNNTMSGPNFQIANQQSEYELQKDETANDITQSVNYIYIT